jgi:hypothetical protein
MQKALLSELIGAKPHLLIKHGLKYMSDFALPEILHQPIRQLHKVFLA